MRNGEKRNRNRKQQQQQLKQTQKFKDTTPPLPLGVSAGLAKCWPAPQAVAKNCVKLWKTEAGPENLSATLNNLQTERRNGCALIAGNTTAAAATATKK